MPSRSIVARWQATMRAATCSASLAVSLPPSSIAWRASACSFFRAGSAA